MSKIVWKDSFSVNNQELDIQHKELIRRYNALHVSLLNDSSEETTRTKVRTLEHLEDYISLHFETEETILKELQFPDLDQHCQQHRDFSNQVESYLQDVKSGKMVLSTSLMKLLQNWITEHVTKEDQKYAEFCRKLNQQDPPG